MLLVIINKNNYKLRCLSLEVVLVEKKMQVVCVTNTQETADFVTFTEEILKGKLHFL